MKKFLDAAVLEEAGKIVMRELEGRSHQPLPQERIIQAAVRRAVEHCLAALEADVRALPIPIHVGKKYRCDGAEVTLCGEQNVGDIGVKDGEMVSVNLAATPFTTPLMIWATMRRDQERGDLGTIPFILYQDAQGMLFVRPRAEFTDGRYLPVE